MIDFEKHHKRLEEALGVENPLTGKNCADKIDEQLWRDEVMKAINEISIESADELQNETGKPYPKDLLLTDPNGNLASVKPIEELLKVTGKLDSDYTPLEDPNGNLIGVRRNLKYYEAPPTRLLSITLILCYWVGFLTQAETMSLYPGAIGAWDRIMKGYDKGKASYPNS
jgi:hypothetical protein